MACPNAASIVKFTFIIKKLNRMTENILLTIDNNTATLINNVLYKLISYEHLIIYS